MRLRFETGIVLMLVLVLLSIISLISLHKMAQMVLTTKTSGSLQKQLLAAVDSENQLLAAELKIKQNPEQYLGSAIGFVPDHLAYDCREGVRIFKVSVPPLESFVAVRVNTTQPFALLNSEEMLAKINGQSLLLLTAADLKQTGTIDRLYVWDQDHIWSVDPALADYRDSYRLAAVNQISHLWVVPDIKGEGVRLYFLGEYLHKKGLFMVSDTLNNSNRGDLLEVVPIIAGDYSALFVRFGRLLLVPSDPSQKPEVLDLPSHQPVSIFLNVSSQLTHEINRIDKDKLGRMVWRKIKK